MQQPFQASRPPEPSPPGPSRPPSDSTGRFAAAWHKLTGPWGLAGYWLALLTATHWPAEFRTDVKIAGIWLDRWVHALLYAPLAWLLLTVLGRGRPGAWWRRFRFLIVPAALPAAAALDEWTQPWFNRSASVEDWLGDAAGVLVVTAAMAIHALVRRLRRATSLGEEGAG